MTHTKTLRSITARTAAALTLFAAALASADETTTKAGGPAGTGGAPSKVEVDPKLPAYAKSTEAIEGNLNSVGSETMGNLMTLWGEGFAGVYGATKVRIQIEGKGSGSAPTALTGGTAQFGPMSRDMKPEEIDGFEKQYGYKPTRLRTGLDALAVFVHRDNPIKSLSLAQVDSIFSATRKRGGKEAATWGDVGLTGEWADKPINLFGRNSVSGTYGFFKEHALKKGDFKNTVKESAGSATVVQGISEDKYAIGYSGMGFATSGVRMVPLSEKDGATAYDANFQNVKDATYPMSRYLNLYVNKAPGQPLSPLVREFCRFIFSKEGQEVVVKDNFLPIDAATADKERKLLD